MNLREFLEKKQFRQRSECFIQLYQTDKNQASKYKQNQRTSSKTKEEASEYKTDQEDQSDPKALKNDLPSIIFWVQTYGEAYIKSKYPFLSRARSLASNQEYSKPSESADLYRKYIDLCLFFKSKSHNKEP